MSYFFVILNMAASATNAAVYAAEGQPLNLGAAVFCGLVAIILAMDE